MKQKRVISFFVTMVMVLSMLPAFTISASATTVTADYEIYTADDLKTLRDNVNSGSNNYDGKNIVLMNDIDLNGSEANQWTPIGNVNNSFKGKFFGNGYKITGLYINTSEDWQGLFGFIDSSAEIKDLGVSGYVKGGSVVGGIVGDNFGTITNCYNECEVIGSSDVGGIAGENIGKIESCYNTGEVDGEESVGGITGYSFGIVENCYNVGAIKGKECAGGIAGMSLAGSTIKNCYNIGEVSGRGNVGGVAGFPIVTIENCYYLSGTAQGGVSGSDEDGKAEEISAEELKTESTFDGWDFDSVWVMDTDFEDRPLLISNREGSSYGNPYKIYTADDMRKLAAKTNDGKKFENKYFMLMNDIDLEGSETNQWTPIGKGNGYNNFSGKFFGNGHKITGLYIKYDDGYQGLFGHTGSGAEIKDLGVSGYVEGLIIDGGIVAENFGRIENCYYIGEIDGEDDAGGIAGVNYGTIKNCYNTGNVTLSVMGRGGGIVGNNGMGGKIEKCYNTGKVSGRNSGGIAGNNYDTIVNCYNTGKVSGRNSGGIAGVNYGTIKNCYNTGKVTGEYNVGGVVGNNSGTVENCYYLSGTAKGGIGGSDEDGKAVGMSADDLKTENTFDGWGFDSVWVMDTKFYERPLLKSNFEGDGKSEATAYRIYTADDMKKFATKVNEGRFDSRDYFVLMKDIDLEGSEANQWTPIGKGSRRFKSRFSGNGHKITGLYINTSEGMQGLFGVAENSIEIKDLGVSGYVKGGYVVGGIVGYAEGGTITNCYNECEVIGVRDVGGITGYQGDGIITRCYNIGAVSGTDYIGGVVGHSFATIKSCYYLTETATGGIAGSDDATNDVVGKEEEEFANGIVAYLLQGNQDKQIWGQRIKGDNIDEYPILSSKAEDKVYKISYMMKGDNGYAEIKASGANADGVKSIYRPASDEFEFVKWVQDADVNSTAEFNENTPVSANMRVYAVGKEITEATIVSGYVVDGIYDTYLEVDLNDYVENKSENDEDITFALADSSTLPDGLDLIDGKIKGTPREVVAKDVTFTVTNNGTVLMGLGLEGTNLTLNIRIGKATPVYTTEPEAFENLEYTGSGIELLKTAGKSTTGTVVKYSLNNTDWFSFEDMPQVTNADKYTVYYKIEGNEYYSDTQPKTIPNINVEPKDIGKDGTETEITLGDELVYNGEDLTQDISSVTVDGKSLTAGTDYTISNNGGRNAGRDYTLTVTGKGNYKGSKTKGFEIKKANAAITKRPEKTADLVYTGEELTLLEKGAEAIGGEVKYSMDGAEFNYDFATIPKVINAKDSYRIWFKVMGNENYNATSGSDYIDVKVEKKPIGKNIVLTVPVKNAAPQTEIVADEYTATVEWTPAVGSKFAQNTEYTATITITAKDNYTVVGNGENVYDVTGAKRVTNEADSDTVVAVFPKTIGGGGSIGGGVAITSYTVRFDTNGGSSVSNQIVIKDEKATEPTKPVKEGYTFGGWYADKEATEKYDFEAGVTENITLYAKWTDGREEDKEHNGWQNPFTDVKESDWFFESVRYANQNGLMSGTTDAEFAPEMTLTRGMLVTILYRLEGEPEVNKSIPFADVKSDMYYAKAVNWAEQNGIVTGVSENEFAPDENVTREQIAVIIYRYAKYKGYDVSIGESTNILSYADYGEVSEYAIEAMQYAVGSGLIKGKTESTLNPKDTATRAEIATILQRFIDGNK